ncbi:PREDICTED: F-box/kelch-repeat protein At1g64840-like isoform X1 [Brassica oleracea var. oleracea]|nr:PREDICTED: F-box/kelch-repeat protein At1g64840-like isoform X1 [Brassica oleracea var. oleracea]
MDLDSCYSRFQEIVMSSMMPDWSLLPEELLHFISQNVENCFDGVHARSVCTSWRSNIPFPSCLLRTSYSLPTFAQFPLENKGSCTLEKIPLFLFRVKSPPPAAATSPCEYFLGGIRRDESEHLMELPSPLQCSVKVNIPGNDPALLNVLDCQIFPLGHQCRMIGWDLEEWRTTNYRGVAFLPLNNGEFIVLLNFTKSLFMSRSDEMRWIQLKKFSDASCEEIVPFRGKFYGTILNRDLFVIDPYSLDVTSLTPLQPLRSVKYLVPSGNDDELFLVEKILPPTGVLDFCRFACRVSKLDDEAGKWVEVSDVGGRVLFIGYPGNVSFCGKELPDGCGLSGDSLLCTGGPGNVTYSYKYGVNTGREEDDLNFWRRFSGENRVTIINTSPVVALQVER